MRSTQLMLLALIGLFAAVSATRMESKTPTLMSIQEMDPLTAQLTNSRFGHMIGAFLEMGLNPKDSGDLFDAFDLVKSALKKLIKEEKESFTKVESGFKSFESTIKTSMDDLKAKITKANDTLETTLYPETKALNKQVADLQKDIQTTQDQVASLRKTHETNKIRWKEEKANLKDMIGAIDKALTIITGKKPEAPKKEHNGTAGNHTKGEHKKDKKNETAEVKPALIQFSMSEFRSSVQDMNDALENLDNYHFKPLIASLLSSASKTSEDNKEGLEKVAKLLEDIKTKLKQQLKDLKAAAKKGVEDYKTAMETQKDLLKTYNQQIALAQKTLGADEAQIMALKANIDELSQNMAKWQESLDALVLDMEKAKKLNQNQLQGLRNEIQLVKKALVVLDQHGITRPVKQK